MTKETPLWRSLMFVPVNVEKFVATANTRGADGYILDLEDSIPQTEKTNARNLIESAAAQVGCNGADILVRINRPWRLAVRDLESCVSKSVCAIALPKVAGPEHIKSIAEILNDLEIEKNLTRGHTKIVAMIETTDALLQARDIAAADPRISAVILGSEDFSSSAGMIATPDTLRSATQQIVFAARAAGKIPLGFAGSITQFSNREDFFKMIKEARDLGFEGSFCIHPLQVEVCNEAFSPTKEEVEEAHNMVAAYADALSSARGAITFNGKMIDEPVVERARQLIRRHDRIEMANNNSS